MCITYELVNLIGYDIAVIGRDGDFSGDRRYGALGAVSAFTGAAGDADGIERGIF